MIRTHDAGTLTAADAGQTVTLAGWVARRRDHGGVAFLDLREASGVAQVVVRDESVAHSLRSEYCVAVTGTVQLRPEGNANPNLPSGEIEVIADTVEVLSAAAPLPFPIDEHVDVGEEARLKHRYLDLRRSGPNAALRLRSKVNKAARDVLDRHDFVEVETPTLTRSTPEGARDFLVPARLQPGSWYALPQSPQLFKQLLMVAGMERYFQIARCYRDEDFRADRQPEFTQLDIEMSFVDQDDVLAISEEVLVALWKLIGVDLPTPFPRMTYAESMARFGSDKPDLRMGLELVDCTDVLRGHAVPGVPETPYVGAVLMPGGASQPRKQLDAWQEWAKQRGARGLAYVLFTEDGELGGPVAKNLSRGGAGRPGRAPRRAAGGLRLLRRRSGQEQPRAARRRPAGDRPPRRPDRRGRLEPRCGWSTRRSSSRPTRPPRPVTSRSAAGAWTAVHHAFTSPQDVDTFDTDPGNALAWAYDIVCNGNEIGGGSIRIHREDVQKRVFAIMGLDEAEAEEKFGFLLDAFKYGAPPHGGLAFGWDRIVALLAGTESIRDVIAFPKSGGGFDPLTAAPAPITPEQRKEAGVDAVPEKDPPPGPDRR